MFRNRIYLAKQPCLNISALYQEGLFKEGQVGTSLSMVREKTIWSLDWTIKNDLILVTYILKEVYRQHRIRLFHQQVHFGGTRTYLICPYCGKNRKQIYFIAGHAACRCCHGLYYRCQSESPFDRSIRASNRLYKRFENLSGQNNCLDGKMLRRARAVCLVEVKANTSQFRKLINSRFKGWI